MSLENLRNRARFTFHYGKIKSTFRLIWSVVERAFTFHYGKIKSLSCPESTPRRRLVYIPLW